MEKRIIFCWFGGKEKPSKVKECIETWRKYMPDWEYLEINENNFDVNCNDYVKEAYKNRYYAYVSDYARLWALYNYGGIYLDTDVEVYKPLDKFLDHKIFTGFEQPHYPVTAVLGAEKENHIIKEMLDCYKDKKFEIHDNWWEFETNTMIMSNIIGEYIDRDKTEYQENEIVVYPIKTFCHSKEVDNEVYARHLMLGNWKN